MPEPQEKAGSEPPRAVYEQSRRNAGGVPSRWEQDGSTFYLTSDGAARRIYFELRRSDLADIGVKKGTLLFEGKKVGNKYEGTAYEFARSCDAKAYDAKGDISADEK